MIVGIEALTLKAAETAVGKLAGGAAAKGGGAAFAKVAAARRNRKVRQRAAQRGPLHTVDGDSLPPDLFEPLQRYLASPDFAHIALSIAMQLLASSREKRQIEGLDGNRIELRASLAASLGVDGRVLNSVAEILFSELSTAVITQADDFRAAGLLTVESQATAIRSAAANATASVRNAEALQATKSLYAYHDFELRLRDQIRNLHSAMKLPHAGTTRKIPYSKLFVQPRLVPLQVTDRDKSQAMEVKDFLSVSLRTVILGDPGGGKSTLSLKLAYDTARGQLGNITSATVPLLVILRDYANDFEQSRRTLVQHLEGLCRFPYNVEPPAGAIEYMLRNDRVLLILDGLDELVDTSLRRKLVDAVEAFVNLYPTVPVLVTSRRVGYGEAPLDEDLFSSVGLAQLSGRLRKSFGG